MFFKSIAFLAATAAALPQLEAPATGDKFGAIAIHSGSAVHYKSVTASQGRISLGGEQKDISCDKGDQQTAATFVLTEAGEAYLYKTDNPPQQLWVDRSGMGQGIIGYTTGVESPPRNSERTGFSISESNYLVFDGKSPQACPTGTDGLWSVWFSDLEKPGYNENCTGVALRAIKINDPVGCLYSS